MFLPESLQSIGFSILVLLEVLVPLWAKRAGHTLWHPEHIAERYGLFTIIVLGESILAATVAVQAAAQAGELSPGLLAIVVGGMLIVFSMWWLYFDQPAHQLLHSTRAGFIWGYGHLPIFASAAAVGAGLAVAVDQATHHAEIGPLGAGLAVALPVAIFLVVLGALYTTGASANAPGDDPVCRCAHPGAALRGLQPGSAVGRCITCYFGRRQAGYSAPDAVIIAPSPIGGRHGY